MATTHTEGKLRALALLWSVLFGGGFVVLASGTWLPVAAPLHLENPLFAFTWLGQGLLFLCTFYLINGIRDNDLCAGIVSVYKFVSGTATILFLLGHAHTLSYLLFIVIIGGLLDYLMGGVTFVLWLRARHSRVVRIPLAYDLEPGVDEEPDTALARAQRLSIAITGILSALTMLALIVIIGSSWLIAHNAAYFEVTAGNTIAVYGTLGVLSMVSAESPQRRFYLLDILLLSNLLAGIALIFWLLHFGITGMLATTLLIGGCVHLAIAAVNLILRIQVSQHARPTRSLGAWRHRVLECFADVIVKGEVEDILPREIADEADTLLASPPAQRQAGFKRALAWIDLGSLLLVRVPFSRMGRLERAHYLTHVFTRGQIFFRALVKIKQLVFFLYYSDPRTFQATGFTPPEEQIPLADAASPSHSEGRHLQTDVCIVGSGAAGAVIAAHLAEAGKRVVVLEEGPHLKRNEDERSLRLKAYRDSGLQFCEPDLSILQGRCVGGSASLSNGTWADPPEELLLEWEKLGAHLEMTRLQESLARVTASSNSSYLQQALQAGTTLVSNCRAERIVTEAGKAQAIEAIRGNGAPLTVEARQIVVACGAIGSSQLLLRSNITHNVGTQLSFNVRCLVFAEFAEPVDSLAGSVFTTSPRALGGKRPRYIVESLTLPPGEFAASLPGWFRNHFDNMRLYRHFAVASVQIGSQPVGEVKASTVPTGALFSAVHFDLPISDLKKLKEGIKQVCRAFLDTGARRVIPATFAPLEFVSVDQLDELDDMVIEPDDLALTSIAPQGGNPLSDDTQSGAIDTSFRVQGFDNLFVCDASVFPTATQVAPQISVMGVADYAARIIAQL